MNTHLPKQRLAHLLGYVGLIPFVLLTLACWTVQPDWLSDFIKGQRTYAISLLPFLGGIHWGAALCSRDLSEEQTKKALLLGIAPSLVAWFSTMVGGFGFAVLMVGYIGAYQMDKRVYGWYQLPEWLLHLRFVLTCVVVFALGLSVMAANLRG